jgi:hypothetical protein
MTERIIVAVVILFFYGMAMAYIGFYIGTRWRKP